MYNIDNIDHMLMCARPLYPPPLVRAGVVKYPTYTVHRSRPAFPTRAALEQYEHMLQLAGECS